MTTSDKDFTTIRLALVEKATKAGLSDKDLELVYAGLNIGERFLIALETIVTNLAKEKGGPVKEPPGIG